MEKQTVVKEITIINRHGERNQISDSDILTLKTSASVEEYCGTFNVTLRNNGGKNSKIAEPKDEIEIWAGYAETGMRKIMAGYIDEVRIQKKEGSGETVEIFGRSYESLLFDHKISGKVEFTKGFSQVVREILDNSPFDLKEIKDSEGAGTVIFRNIPIIDLIRQLSEMCGWVFRIDRDKVFYFQPTLPTKSHTRALTTKNMKSYKIIKR